MVRGVVKAWWMWRCTEVKPKNQLWLAWEGWLQQSCLISTGMKEDLWKESGRAWDRQRDVCSELLYKEFRPLKARCHTIKVSYGKCYFQDLFDCYWAFYQVATFGKKGGRQENRETSPTNYQFCAFKSLITRQRNQKYWKPKCSGRWSVPRLSGRKACGKVTWPTLPPPHHHPGSPRARGPRTIYSSSELTWSWQS